MAEEEDVEDALAGMHRLEKDPFYAKEIEVEVEAALEQDRAKMNKLNMGLIKRACLQEMGAEPGSIPEDELVQSILQAKALRLDGQGLRRIENLEMFGGQLTELYLQYNNITVMENLEMLTSLKILALHGNKIEKVDGIRGLRCLEYLNVADNRIATLDPDQDLPPSLEALDLSNNPLGTSADADELQEDLVLALPELLLLNGKRIQHRFRELFDIVGTSASDADSFAAGGNGGEVLDLEEGDVPAASSVVAPAASGVSSGLRERSTQQLQEQPDVSARFSSQRDAIFARMQARREEFAAQQGARHQANVAKARSFAAARQRELQSNHPGK